MSVGALLHSYLRDQIAARLAKLTAEEALLLADWLIEVDYMSEVGDFDELIARLPDEGMKC
jgi:hypothetical protein